MPTRLLLWALLCLSVSPLHTKVAGLTWLLLLIAAAFSMGSPRHQPHPNVELAGRYWLAGVAGFMASVIALALIWPSPEVWMSSDMNTWLRLMTAAWAALVLIQRANLQHNLLVHTHNAVAVALLLGFVCVLLVGRELPSHPIPWAVSMALWVAFLLPHALAKAQNGFQIWALRVSAALGMCAVLLSQSRGAYAIILWPLVLVTANSPHLNRFALLRAGGWGAISIGLLTTSALLPADPLRLRQAWQEVVTSLETQDFNSSLGARVYLFQTGWAGFVESPWIGLGATERLRRLQNAGLGLPTSEQDRYSHVRELGHVHNQYLHQAMDGGLVGLTGLMALVCALVAAAWRLRHSHRIASQQLAGVAFVHTTASLSNVNFAHNYYALMLGLGVSWVLIQAAASQREPTG